MLNHNGNAKWFDSSGFGAGDICDNQQFLAEQFGT